MTSTSKALVPVAAGRAPAIVTAAKLPAPVKAGLTDLVVAFATGTPAPPEERAALLRIYAEATEGFPLEVVTDALRRLRFHNPRNPFRPTPQDVYEACLRELRRLRGHIAEWHRNQSDEPLPPHAGPLIVDVLRETIENARRVDHYHYPSRDWRARLAESAGDRLDHWPRELLDEFKIPYGDRLAEILKQYAERDAEDARRQERHQAEERAAARYGADYFRAPKEERERMIADEISGAAEAQERQRRREKYGIQRDEE